jgi:hypothetical protein
LDDLGVAVHSVAEVGLPDPRVDAGGLRASALTRASFASSKARLPALGMDRVFTIEPLLDGAKRPRWSWRLPWLGPRHAFVCALRDADRALIDGGYCGPNDRGAYFETCLCFAEPDREPAFFETRVEGQLTTIDGDIDVTRFGPRTCPMPPNVGWPSSATRLDHCDLSEALDAFSWWFAACR